MPNGPNGEKRPADAIGLAVMIGRIATGEIEEATETLATNNMTGIPKFKSSAFEAIHDAVAGMYRAGTIEKATLRDFDAFCLAAGNRGRRDQSANKGLRASSRADLRPSR